MEPRKIRPYVSAKTIRRARALRTDMPQAEVLLWDRLRQKQLGGFRFRRQHPIEPYIVDFACVEVRVAVEIDGLSHADRASYDANRDERIAASGWLVLRYSDDDVWEHMEAVLEDILKHCSQRRGQAPT